jgi:tRNA (guanine-N7-)-methyltransferase
MFQSRGDIEIEIGLGRGMFLLERGRSCPEASLLGIEMKRKWVYLVSQRCLREGLNNVRVVAADARDLLPKIVPGRSVKRFFIHFPDPWWKRRHAKRRLVDRLLFDAIGRLLEPAGELFLQTDVEERALFYVEQLRATDGFRFPTHNGFVDANPYGARSNRERRVEQDGLPVYRILAERV